MKELVISGGIDVLAAELTDQSEAQLILLLAESGLTLAEYRAYRAIERQ